MNIAGFALFFFVSHIGAMQVFRLTTYHRYFWPALPLLAGYAALVGWALFALELHEFFLWQLALASAWLFFVGRKQGKTANAMLEYARDDADTVRFMAKSVLKTTAFYTGSSIIYVVGFAVTYLWLYNR